MSDDMEKRISRAEWRLEHLEGRQDKQDSRMAALGERIDSHHREVMAAISGLKEDSTRREGLEEARREAEENNFKRIKALGIIISMITGLVGLGFLTWPGASG